MDYDETWKITIAEFDKEIDANVYFNAVSDADCSFKEWHELDYE
jgi:hypothetical protein